MKRESPIKFYGKAGIAKAVIEYIPNDIERIVSPFVGSGFVEMILADRGVEVVAYDGDEMLVNWWQQWKRHPERIADDVKTRMLMGSTLGKKNKKKETGLFVPPEYFYRNKRKRLGDYDSPYHAAVNYWLHNRSTMRGGEYQNGWFMQCYATEKIFNKIRAGCPKNLTVFHQDWETTLRSHTDDFLFIDPPYTGLQKEMKPNFKWNGHKGVTLPKNGEWPGHKAFYGNNGSLTKDFERLHNDLRDHLYHRSNWVMCNFDHPETHRVYESFPRKLLAAGVKKKETGRSHELLIFPQGTEL